MSEFTNFDPTSTLVPIPHAKEVLGRDHWIVSKGFEFYIGKKEDNCYVYIPKGYLTDGATVPPFLQRLVPTWGQYGAATIVHDYLCEQLTIRSEGQERTITRARGDYIFLEAMKVLHVPLWRRLPMYLAVRVYSFVMAGDKPTPWEEKRLLELALEANFNEHGDYDFSKEKQ